MKTVSLSGSPREGVGKKDAATLRHAERVPCVLYGGENQFHFHVKEIDIKKVVHSPDVYKIQLDIDGSAYNCIIQDIQFHPVTDRIVHVDLLQVLPTKEIKVDLPLRVTGASVGVLNGGQLSMNARKIPVMGLADNIPDELSVDITELTIGDSIRAGEIEIEGCRLLQNPADVVVSVNVTRAAMSAAMEDVAEGEEGEEGTEGTEGAEGAEGEGDKPAEGGEE